MLGNAKARNVGTTIATPFAKIFLKICLTPDLITLIGTIGVSVVSLIYFSMIPKYCKIFPSFISLLVLKYDNKLKYKRIIIF